MPKKRAENSHKVVTKEEKRARKEHESTSHVEGATATLDAGIERDRVANLVPTVEEIQSVVGFLEFYRKNQTAIAEVVEAKKVISEEVAESTPKIVEEEIDKSIEEVIIDTEEVMTEDEKEDVIEAVEEVLEAVSEPSDVLAELESQIAELKAKKEALEK